MPTERYLRLPKEKRKVIWETAFREFARTTMDKVSINRIIQDAGISRGSFYTYFADKYDLFDYLLDTIAEMTMQSDYITDLSSPDIWDLMEVWVDKLLTFAKKPVNREFITNLCKSVGTPEIILKGNGMDLEDMPPVEKEKLKAFYSLYQKGVSEKKLISLDKRRMENFIRFCRYSIGTALIDFIGGKAEEKIREDFTIRQEILKRSVEDKG